MTKYRVRVDEPIERFFHVEVEADTATEAVNIVQDNYDNGAYSDEHKTERTEQESTIGIEIYVDKVIDAEQEYELEIVEKYDRTYNVTVRANCIEQACEIFAKQFEYNGYEDGEIEKTVCYDSGHCDIYYNDVNQGYHQAFLTEGDEE